LSVIFILYWTNFGVKHSAVAHFNYSYNYYKVLDIYNVKLRYYYSMVTRILYTLGPITLVSLLAFIEFKRSRKAVLFLIIAVSIFSSAFNGGLAYRKYVFDRYRFDFFYDVAPVLNKVPSKKFAIYVHRWNAHPNFHRILWVYETFFNKKYPYHFAYDARIKVDKVIYHHIAIIKNESELLSTNNNSQILTDNLKTIRRWFVIKKMIKIKWNGQILYLVNVSPYPPVFQYAFKTSNNQRVVNIKHLTSFNPSLTLQGLRGNFNIQHVQIQNTRFIKILSIAQKNSKKKLMVQFGYTFNKKDNLFAKCLGKKVIFMTQARLAGRAKKNTASIFIRDKTANWKSVATRIKNKCNAPS